MTNERILRRAFRELGTKEVDGDGNNPRIQEYHRFATVRNDEIAPDSVPWCASFVCWVLEAERLESTNSKMARSFERLGREVAIKDYLPGDIVTFYRNGHHSGQGHVGFLVWINSGKAYVLGGNQSDQVSVTKYSLDKMTSIRRVTDEANIDTAKLKKLSIKIIYADPIRDAGSVT